MNGPRHAPPHPLTSKRRPAGCAVPPLRAIPACAAWCPSSRCCSYATAAASLQILALRYRKHCRISSLPAQNYSSACVHSG